MESMNPIVESKMMAEMEIKVINLNPYKLILEMEIFRSYSRLHLRFTLHHDFTDIAYPDSRHSLP